jgi:hypothetical protein
LKSSPQGPFEITPSTAQARPSSTVIKLVDFGAFEMQHVSVAGNVCHLDVVNRNWKKKFLLQK